MNKLWYTTIFLALAVTALGVVFFFVLPRNRPSNGDPIALLDQPSTNRFGFSEREDKLELESPLSPELEPVSDGSLQESNLEASPEVDPHKELLKKQDFPAYGDEGAAIRQDDSPPIRTVPSNAPSSRAVPSSSAAQPFPAASAGAVQVVSTDRPKTGSHKVVSGEWFAHITNQYWGDFFLWPDLYTLNRMRDRDPDLIYPGELVHIYQSLVEDDRLDAQEKKVLIDAYLRVYRIYKELGPGKNQSVWRLLYSATRYEPDFLEIYRDQIETRDRDMAAQLVKEARHID